MMIDYGLWIDGRMVGIEEWDMPTPQRVDGTGMPGYESICIEKEHVGYSYG